MTIQEPMSPKGEAMSTKMTNYSVGQLNDGKNTFNNSRKPEFNLNPRSSLSYKFELDV